MITLYALKLVSTGSCAYINCVEEGYWDCTRFSVEMVLKLRCFRSTSLIVFAVTLWECMGIIPIRDLISRKQEGESSPVTGCNFGNKNLTIGDEWNPHLEPNGINYCITCRCKKDGLVHCVEKKCKTISCPGKSVPTGKCCATCPSPENGVARRNQQCHYGGKRYQKGEVWNIPMRKEVGDNNCAECTCHNGKASCAIRICPKLNCATIMQVKGKDSCCTQCRGFPLTPVGGLSLFKPAVTVQGSCFQKGRYYKNSEMWNPLASTSEVKIFQRPNCDLCVCRSTEVRCNPVLCQKLECANPIQSNPNDCCKSCPDQQVLQPFNNHTLPQNASQTTSESTDERYPDCKFLSTIYKHNSSFTPQIPGHNSNSCVRCTCKLSKIKCNRNGCRNNTRCTGKSCSRAKKCRSSNPNPAREIIEVYLLERAAKQKYVARIALISPTIKGKRTIKVHVWNVTESGATIKSTKPNKSRFKKRKTNYQKVGETKKGRINRFFNKEKTLGRCSRNCINKAKDFINSLKDRYLLKPLCKEGSKALNLFRSLKPSLP